MSPVRALALAFGPDPDAPPMRGFLLVAVPGLLVALGLRALACALRAGDDNLADLGGDD